MRKLFLSACLALSALAVSADNRYSRTLVSKKSSPAFIGFDAIELEVRRQSTTVLA